MHIDSYTFGRITIDGKTYTSDLILLPEGRLQEEWWRRRGHELHPQDLQEILQARPQILIVGTGYYGAMRITPEAKQTLTKAGIQLIAHKTEKACQTYNKLAAEGKRVAAALHLTC